MNSKIEKISDINYGEEIIISEIKSDPQYLEMHKERVKALNPNSSDDEIQKIIFNLLLKENAFNAVMDNISKKFKYKISKTDLDSIKSQVIEHNKESKEFQARSDEWFEEISKRIIIKSLIFAEIAKENNISITDEETNEYLKKYEEATKNSINVFTEDKQKFEGIKNLIFEEKVTNWLLNKFDIKFNIPEFNENKEEKSEQKKSKNDRK